MVKIREDIFPNLKDDIFDTRANTLDSWINEALEPFQALFPTKNTFINYLNSFKKPQDAELFIRLSHFYGVSKIYEKSSYVKLIMIVSIIEKMVTKEKKYVPFKDWIFTQNKLIKDHLSEEYQNNIKSFKNILKILKKEYHKKYGSQRNVFIFFKKYVNLKDKIEMIKSFKLQQKDVVSQYTRLLYTPPHLLVNKINKLSKYNYKIMKIHMPICYNWKYCYVQYGVCHPDIGCLLKVDQKIRNKILRDIVSVIYGMRSDFVHNAKVPPISKKGIDFTVGTYKKEIVFIEISIDKFEKIFEHAFKKYFDGLKHLSKKS